MGIMGLRVMDKKDNKGQGTTKKPPTREADNPKFTAETTTQPPTKGPAQTATRQPNIPEETKMLPKIPRFLFAKPHQHARHDEDATPQTRGHNPYPRHTPIFPQNK